MKSFKTILNEIKLAKARRLARAAEKPSRGFSIADFERSGRIETALSAARRRLDTRAMSASIDGDHEKASAIASGMDVLTHERSLARTKSLNKTGVLNKPMEMPKRSTTEAEYYAKGPAATIEKRKTAMADLIHHANTIRGGNLLNATPFVRQRVKDAVATLGSEHSSMGPGPFAGAINRDIAKRNVFNHIMRSRLAGAAVRAGFKADDVPAFEREKPILVQQGNQQLKKYPPFGDKGHGPNKL